MNSKLEPYIKTIKERYVNGETAKEIGKDYGVYPNSITRLLRKYDTIIRVSGQPKGAVPWNKGKDIPDLLKIEFSRNLFKNGNIIDLAEQTIRSHAKRILINDNGNTCSVCNETIWCGRPIPLVCDHIDGNSNNCSFNNFRLVCCNCDAQLPTYKSKNRGNGRTYDRQRYHKVKASNIETVD